MPNWRRIGDDAANRAERDLFFRLGMAVGAVVSAALIAVTVLITGQQLCFG